MQSQIARGKPVRLHYLDWLRVFAILMVFVYHSSRFFNLETWHIKIKRSLQMVLGVNLVIMFVMANTQEPNFTIRDTS